MGFVSGEGRKQGILSAVCLEEVIPDHHACRVLDTFVDRLNMAPWLRARRGAKTGRRVMILAT
jgi:hypothetical protein